MDSFIASLLAEQRKYKRLAEIALAQLQDSELYELPAPGSNSAASLVWHVSGNLKSRFLDFLTTDGEKPWRNKLEEFNPPHVPREQMLARWEEAWNTLFDAFGKLTAADLAKTVTIAGQPHRVDEALHRSLAHTSYHVGQLVFLAKSKRGPEWKPSKTFN